MAAENEEVKLIGVPACPFVSRVQIALNMKGVDYEYLSETLWPQKSDLLLKSNPVTKQIPVLIHNGRTISESMITVEYIDETWASSRPSILPSDAHDRAVARFWAAFVDDKFPSQFRIILGRVQGDTKAAAEQLAGYLKLLEEVFEKCSKGKSFFGGDDIGYLDIALGAFASFFKSFEKTAGVKLLEKEKIPHLVAWIERFCAHDAVKEVLLEPDELAKIVAVYVAVFKSELGIPAAN